MSNPAVTRREFTICSVAAMVGARVLAPVRPKPPEKLTAVGQVDGWKLPGGEYKVFPAPCQMMVAYEQRGDTRHYPGLLEYLKDHHRTWMWRICPYEVAPNRELWTPVSHAEIGVGDVLFDPCFMSFDQVMRVEASRELPCNFVYSSPCRDRFLS